MLGPQELEQSEGAESSPSPAAHPALDAARMGSALGVAGKHWSTDGCGAGKRPFQYNSILYTETSSESELVY